ncbi:MAG: hypothetical protein N4A33_06055 [Bacteriovoracaceae bacterium]|jgi:hypothetical protein|nr:hypothetical protein [Bacteriovoracaceae bacterium]
MRYLLVFLTLNLALYASEIVSSNISQVQTWTKYSSNKKLNLKVLLSKLAKSKTGKEILIKAKKKAKSFGKSLYEVILEGNGSLTDTTLYRKFSAIKPQDVIFESESIVYLNKTLSQYDALLDLAHELTHFVHRKPFNPYVEGFTLDKFIQSTVEDEGGEVHAFLTECKVVKELFANKLKHRHNCKKIMDKHNNLSIGHAKEHFYSVGGYYKNFLRSIASYDVSESVNKINNKEIRFVSSAYGVPYPVAAFYEYASVMEKVCANDRARLALLKSQGRSIASTNITHFEKNIKKRCYKF